jgi:hypothetical protein
MCVSLAFEVADIAFATSRQPFRANCSLLTALCFSLTSQQHFP